MAGTTTPTSWPPDVWTMADFHRHLGDVPPERIRMIPLPGTATVEDAVKSESGGRMVCELIDGTLVEKTMGALESRIAVTLARLLDTYLDTNDLGLVFGEAGPFEILAGQVRIPDVCFVAWQRLPDRRLPERPIPAVAPNLAVEILSHGNTRAEMQRKLDDYFAAGVQLVWYIDPPTRTARVYTAVDQWTEIDEQGVLSGGDVLPGFELSLADLFARAERRGIAGEADATA